MNFFIYLVIFLLVSCGGGGGVAFSDINNSIEIENESYSYSPPSGNSRDNCVAKSPSSDWLDDFIMPQLDLSKWSYDEGCNNNGGGCNGNNELQLGKKDKLAYPCPHGRQLTYQRLDRN